jgi:hypothetical protein
MAVVDLGEKGRFPELKTVPLIQRLDSDRVGTSDRLPSFLYWPTEAQRAELVPFGYAAQGWVMGHGAAEMGRRIKGRLVNSAKSWLCHSKIDRTSKILPWGAEEGVEKISPLLATQLILEHLRYCWEQSEWGAAPLKEQALTITLPASFDQTARALTVEAAALAGLGQARLLEEPQAAFYNWISLRKGRWSEALQGRGLVLVCDIGGGTSDFSLIRCKEDEEQMHFDREAVGAHLLLGGDNIDLALAHRAEQSLKGSSSLNLSQWQLLSQLARRAKEDLLSGTAEEVELRLPGAGRKVIGGLRKATLTKQDAESLVLDGFFPSIDNNYQPRQNRGLQELGLPYESEPAVTWHILDFIRRHKASGYPGAVLFNGGSLEPSLVRDRILEVLERHAPEGEKPLVLDSDSLAEAVARGAAYYSFTTLRGGLRVGGGSPHAYYVGLKNEAGVSQICVLPKGSEAHEVAHLNLKGLEVRTNHPVAFELYCSDAYPLDEVGTVRSLEGTPVSGKLNTLVRFGKHGDRSIPVSLEVQLTELDTLQMNLQSVHTEHRWNLEFDLRSHVEEVSTLKSSPHGTGESVEVNERPKVEASLMLMTIPPDLKPWILSSFEGAQPKNPLKLLEEQLGVKRQQWDVPFLRACADVLLEAESLPSKSAAYEANWLMALSYCCRPGFGDSKDEWRRQRIWTLCREGAQSSRDIRAQTEWALLWRRLSAGLEEGRQADLFQRHKRALCDKKSLPDFKGSGAELWRMCCSMEVMPAKDKLKLGKALLESAAQEHGLLETKLWCLGRLGSRQPIGARVEFMLSGEEVSSWIHVLLSHPEWQTSGGSYALLECARRCGDRHLDINESLREKVAVFLGLHATMPESAWKEALERSSQRNLLEQGQLLGETLPLGLELKA